jgi:hypothetical protein
MDDKNTEPEVHQSQVPPRVSRRESVSVPEMSVPLRSRRRAS